jgi:type VI protein secretion system component VasK
MLVEFVVSIALWFVGGLIKIGADVPGAPVWWLAGGVLLAHLVWERWRSWQRERRSEEAARDGRPPAYPGF